MTWHKNGLRFKDKEGRLNMGHPSDGKAWRNFDAKHPNKANDARNVRIAIATDGFNPYGPDYPGKNLSVFMQPLVDDLHHSWHHGTLTYDRATKTNSVMKTHYKVPDDMVEQGKAVLTRACQRLTRQQWYNQKHTCIGHFKAEQGMRVKKADNIRDDPQLTKEDYLKVMPLWCENKEDAFEALVARWVGEDADFNAKSARNKANRGTGGTQCGKPQH
ncbi:hypothetical protein QYE76_004554 [Lolium multiflorum]|uniref:Uncharacterized protein n=1 Tax=Lolium multiflorum TaxID=4521 RepID=A0AAD8RT26_LOLMU|nr:hypothetical protein QYE76_004554 [Lolium multiflorum]